MLISSCRDRIRPRLAGVVLLALLVTSPPIAQGTQSLTDKFESPMFAICAALDLFKLDTHRYPTRVEGLAVLLPNAGGMPIPPGMNPAGYLRELPTDPWGRPYAYQTHDGGFRLFSYGADGVPGGRLDDRDINGCSKTGANRRQEPAFIKIVPSDRPPRE
jgi:general secretion pathway protein G